MGNSIQQACDNTIQPNLTNNINVDSIYMKTQSYSLDNLCTVIRNLCEVSHKQLSLRNNAHEKVTFNTTIPLFDVCSVNTHRSQQEWETIYNQISSYYMSKISTNKHHSHICNSSLLCLSKIIAILLSVNNKQYTNNYQTMLLIPLELIYTKNTSSTTTAWPFTQTLFEYVLAILNTETVIVSTGWNVIFNIIKHALTQSPSNVIMNYIIEILRRTECEIERNVRNVSVYKGYIEFICQFYVMNNNALKDTIESILQRLLCVALTYVNSSNNTCHTCGAVVLCKYYFFALDEFMLNMNVSFHLKIVFDLIESTFTYNNNNSSAVSIFKCVYNAFIKVHHIILLMSYNQSNDISTLITQIQTELNRKGIEIESEYVRKKVELLRKITEDEYNNNVSDFIEKFMNLMYIAFESNDNETKSIYYGDFITTSIDLIQYHSSPHLLFDITRDMLISIESDVSSSFWKEILNTITTTVKAIRIQKDDNDDGQTPFCVLLFIFIEKVVNYIPHEVFSDNNSNVSDLYVCLYKLSNALLLKLINEDNEQMYLIVESIAKIKVSIYNESITVHTVRTDQCEVVLYYKHLHSLYKCKCSCDSANTLMSIIYIEYKYILPKVIGHFDKENRRHLFNMLIDLLVDERSHIRLICKELMSHCFNNGVCAFHVNSLQS